MIRISQLQLEWYQIVVLVLIGLFVFGFTYWLYPYIISWMKRKKYVGYDIHKQSRPETAESGGIAFSISITFGLIMLGFIIPTLWHEVFIFIITILIATVVGWI
ncbi:MAG: hypothetical protein ACTSUK_05210, partial [Promethearchaeota archaeon]